MDTTKQNDAETDAHGRSGNELDRLNKQVREQEEARIVAEIEAFTAAKQQQPKETS
jgi:hypothetical protein